MLRADEDVLSALIIYCIRADLTKYTQKPSDEKISECLDFTAEDSS